MGVHRLSRRKRKKSSNASFTYEVYGILILIISVIALAAGRGEVPGMGPIGRALNYICLFLAGELAPAIPLIAIYVGLYVMIKRSWPKTWSHKKTGVTLLFLIALGLVSISTFRQMYPDGTLTATAVFTDPFDNLKQYLSDETMSYNDFLAGVGGGVIGAAVFGVLFLFFDFTGSRFVLFALIPVAVLYLTGWSYVEFFRRIKTVIGKAARKAGKEAGLLASLFRRKRRKPVAAAAVPSDAADDESGEEDADDGWTSSVAATAADAEEAESAVPEEGRKRKKGTWFGRIRSRKEPDAPDGTEADGEPADAASLPGETATSETAPWMEGDAPPADDSVIYRHFGDFAEARDDRPDGEPVEDEPPAAVPDPTGDDMLDEVADLSAPKPPRPYKLPPPHLLARPVASGRGAGTAGLEDNARKLAQTLASFGVKAKISDVVRGPAVTRYEITPEAGVKVSRIVSLTDDIALALAARDIRMEAPIPGKSAIGIEVPNEEVALVTMREVMESPAFRESPGKLSVVLGRDISGQPIVANLAKMPHLLVAGATGSGKSVCINAIIVSILYKARPDEVKFMMVDPKMVELNVYNGIPHLLAPVVTDPRRASLALKKIVQEMEKRYELFSKSATRNIEGYNAMAREQGQEMLPYIVVIVDELADLMMVAPHDVEDAITRLAQMARAAGIHLIIATQRPSVDVITGVIKANIPSRIAFGVSSQVDSRTILDMAGAEKLLGRGDMLYLPVGESKPIRVQGAFLSDKEVEAVVNYVRAQGEAEYREELVPEVAEEEEAEDELRDELFDQAAMIVLEARQASVSLLQRRLRIGYTRAARLIDSMEAAGIIGPYEGSKPRDVLMTVEQYLNSRSGA